MFLGFDAFNPSENAVYINGACFGNYNNIELRDSLLDEIFIDTRIYIGNTNEKPTDWEVTTVLNAKFQNNIEAGSIKLAGLTVDTLRFQKRTVGDTEWSIVGDVEFKSGDIEEYTFLDKNIRNNYEYEYSVIPLSQNIMGNRIISDPIHAQFEGLFISDRHNNYMLIYNANTSDITHNVGMHAIQTLNSQYPYVIFDNTNYRSGNVSAILVFDNDFDIYNNIKSEHMQRADFIKFLTNKQPKTLRFMNGDSLIVNIIGQPVEQFIDGVTKYMGVTFEYVEVDSFDTGGLIRSELYEVIGGDNDV